MRKSIIIVFALLMTIFVALSAAACDDVENTTPEYTVSFYNGETLVSTETVQWGENVVFPLAEPTKESDELYEYVFKGWATSPDSTEVITNVVSVFADMNFYAIFTAREIQKPIVYFTVSFIDDLTGQLIGEPQQIEQGGDAVLPTPPDHSDLGYKFDGWSASHQNIRRTVTIRALYSINNVTLTRHYLDQSRAETIPSNSQISLEAPTISSAFVFEGWYWDSEFTRPVTQGDNLMPLTDADVYAKLGVNFAEAELEVSDELVYGNQNTVSVVGLSGEGTLQYTFVWSGDELTQKDEDNATRILRNAGDYELSVTITATYSSGGEVYLTDSHQLQGSYTVDKAELLVSLLAGAEQVTYGQTMQVAYQVSVEDLKHDDSQDLVLVTLSYYRGDDLVPQSQLSQLPVGEYSVSATVAELDNYYVPQVEPINFAVVKKDVTVDFSAKSYVYGDDLSDDFVHFEFICDESQFVYGQDSSELGEPQFQISSPSYSANYPTALNQGVYLVAFSGLSSDNYNVIYAKQTTQFTVSPREASVTVSAANWVYGQDEQYSYQIAGALQADIASFNVKYSFEKNGSPFLPEANKRFGAGEYTVTVTHEASSNYAVLVSPKQSFVVSKATVSSQITFTNSQEVGGQWKYTYGTVPEFKVEYFGFVDNERDSLVKNARVSFYNGGVLGNAATLNAATYQVKIEGLNNLENYVYVEPEQQTIVSVDKKAFEIDVLVAQSHLTYGKLKSEITGNCSYKTDEFQYDDDVLSVFTSISLELRHDVDGSMGDVVSGNILYVGKYFATVKLGKEAANYNVTVNNVSFTIDKALLSVSVEDEQIVYGQQPTKPLNAQGFAGFDNISGSLVYMQGETEFSATKLAVGEYDVKVKWSDQAAMENYEWSQPQSKVTVTPKTLSLSFQIASITYGQELATAYDIDGFVYGETIQGVFGELAIKYFSGDDEYASKKFFDAGAYTAQIVGLDSANYVIDDINKARVSFTVAKKAVTVSDEQTYDRLQNDWSYTPTVDGFNFDGKLQLNTTNVGTYVWNGQKHDEQLSWEGGKYTIWLQDEDVTKNFSLTYQVSVSLLASQFKFTQPGQQNFTYDASAHQFPVSVDGILYEQDNGNEIKVEYSLDDVDYTTVAPSFINAGEYTVYYRISSVNYVTKQGSFDINCAKATSVISGIKVVDQQFTYDGEERTYDIIANATFGEVVVRLNGMVVSGNQTLVNAGAYTFTFTVEDTGNYYGATQSRSITINKANRAIDITNAQKTAYVYNGYEQTVTLDGITLSDGEGQIRVIAGETTFKSVPQNGKITLTLGADQTANYNAAQNVEFTVTVAKANYGVTAPDQTEYVYNGEQQGRAISVTALANDQLPIVQYTYSGDTFNSVSLVNAGRYTVTYLVQGNGDYNEKTGSFVVEIQKANNAITPMFQSESFVYDATSHAYNLSATATYGRVIVTLNGSEVNGQSNIRNVGEYKFVFTVEESQNYKSHSIDRVITVTKAEYEVLDIQDQNGFVYNGGAYGSDITVVALGEDRFSVTYVVTVDGQSRQANSVLGLGLVNAGSYEVSYAVNADEANYNQNALTSGSFTVTIDKASRSIDVSKAKTTVYTYTGSEQQISLEGITLTDSEGEITVKSDNQSFIDAPASGKITLVLGANETANYYAASQVEFTVTVNKAINSISDILIDNATFVYDGEQHIYDITASSKFGNVVVTLNGLEVSQNQALLNAGRYEFVFTVAADKNNYDLVSQTRVVTINKANYDITANNQQTTYLGVSFGQGVSVQAIGDDTYTLNYVAQQVEYGANAPTFVNVGNYTVNFTVSGNENYEDAVGSYTVQITKANLSATVTLSKNSITYGEQVLANISWSGFVAGEDQSNIGNYDSAIKLYKDGQTAYQIPAWNLIDVGSYVVKAEGLVSDNYAISVTNANLTVSAQQFVIRVRSTQNYSKEWSYSPSFEQGSDFVFNGRLTLNVAQEEQSVGVYTLTSAPQADSEFVWSQGAPTITYQGNDVTQNFSISYDISVTLNSHSFTINFPDFVDYDGSEHFVRIEAGLEDNQDNVAVNISYSISGQDDSYGQVAPSFTEVGKYTVYYIVSAEGYRTATGSFTFEIKQIVNQITTNLKDITSDLTYNGSAKYSLDLSGTKAKFGDGVSVSYKYTDMANVTTSLQNPDFINAGTYTITITSQDDGKNYTADTQIITVVIGQAEYNVDAQNQSYVYNGAAQGAGVTVTGVNGEQFEAVYSPSYQFQNVGTYTVTYWVTENNNYKDVTGSYVVSISKAQAVIEAKLSEMATNGVIERTYNATDYQFGKYSASAKLDTAGVVVDLTSELNMTVSYNLWDGSEVEFSDDFVNAGTYVIVYTVQETQNYNGAELSFTIVINKATYAVQKSDIPSDGYIYNASKQGISVAVTDVSGNPVSVTYTVNDVEQQPSTVAPTFTDVNTYNVWYYVAANDNYQALSGSYVIVIDQAQTVIDATLSQIATNGAIEVSYNATDYQFDGYSATAKLAQADVAVELNKTVTYKRTDGSAGEFDGSFISAGTYLVTYTVQGNDNYIGTSTQFTIVIKQVEYTFTAPQNQFVYSGEAQGDQLISVSGVSGDDIGEVQIAYVSGYQRTNASTYQIEFTVSGNQNYVAQSTSYVYTLTIIKADYTVIVPSATYEYNGQKQGEKAKAYDVNGVEVSALTISEYQFVHAGTHTVTYEVAGNDNYNAIEQTEYSVVITQTSYEVEVAQSQSHIYNATAFGQGISVTAFGQDTFDVTYDYYELNGQRIPLNSATVPTFVNAGTYTVYYIVSGNGDYYDYSGNYTVTINKAARTASGIDELVTAYQYDAAMQAVNVDVVTLNDDEGELVITSTLNGNAVSFTDVPSGGQFVLTFSAEETANYLAFEQSVTVTVTKADYVVASSSQTYEYSGDKHGYGVTVTAKGDDQAPTVTYTYNGSAFDQFAFVNAGEYEIAWSIAENGNYNGASGKFTVVIEQASNNAISGLTFDDGSFTYDGEQHTYDISATATFGDVVVKLNGSIVSGNQTLVNAGTYVFTFEVAQTANYVGATATRTVTINKAARTASGIDELVTAYQYDAAMQAVNVEVVTLNDDEGELVITSTLNGNAVSFTDVPSGGQFVLTFSAEETANYLAFEQSVTVTVTKADYVVTATSQTYEYNGDKHGYGVTVTAKGDDQAPTVTYTYNGSALDEIAFVNAGEYEIAWSIAENGNYNGASGKFTVSISKFTLVVDDEITNQTYQYNATEQGVGLTLASQAPDDGYTIKYSLYGYNASDLTVQPFGFVNVDEYTVFYRIQGDNYQEVLGTFTVIITPKSISIAGVPNSVVQDYSEQGYTVPTMSVSGIMDADKDKATISVNVTKDNAAVSEIKNKGLYYVNYRLVLDSSIAANYTVEVANGYYTVTIEGIELTLDASHINTQFTYNASEQTVDFGAVKIMSANGEITLAQLVQDDATTKLEFSATKGTMAADGKYSFTTVNEGNGAIITIKLTVGGDSNYANAETTIQIAVAKGNYTAADLPSVDLDEQIMKLGRTIGELALPAGYTWINGSQAIQLGSVEYDARYNGDPDNYNDYEQAKIEVVARKEVVTVTYTEKVEANLGEIDASNYKNTFVVTFIGELLRGESHELTAAELDGRVSYTVSGANYTIGSTYVMTYALTFTDNDYFELSEDSTNTFTTWLKLKSVDVGGVLYTIEDALNQAESGIAKLVAGKTQFATTATKQALSDAGIALYQGEEYYTVKSGVTLLLPIHSTDTGVVNQNKDYKEIFNNVTNIYSTLIVSSGVQLSVNGSLVVNGARVNTGNATSHTDKKYGYGEMDVQSNATVTINKDAQFVCYGFAYGSGEIIAKSGSKAYEPFSLTGWKGGSISLEVIKKAFPINQYTFANIICNLKIEYGAKYSVKAAVSGSVGITMYVDQEIEFISTGKSSFIQMTSEGYISKYVDEVNGNVHFDIHSDTTFNNITITIVALVMTFSTSDSQMPIPGHFKINVFDSVATVPSGVSLKLLPGASVYADAQSTVVVQKGGCVYAYGGAGVTFDGEDRKIGDDNFYGVDAWQDGNNKFTYPHSKYSEVYRLEPAFDYDASTPAVVEVNGRLEVNGTLAASISGGEGAVMVIDSAAELSVYGLAEDYTAYSGGAVNGFFTSNIISYGLDGDGNSLKLMAGTYEYQGNRWIGQNTVYNLNYHFGHIDNGGNYVEIQAQPNNPYSYTPMSAFELSDAIANDSGYRFLGWYEESSCVNAITTLNGKKGDITLYALFEPIVADVYVFVYSTKYPDDSTGINIASEEVAASDIADFTPDAGGLILANDVNFDVPYYFDGWYLDEACTIPFSVDNLTATGVVTLYPKWISKIELSLQVSGLSSVTLTSDGASITASGTYYFKPGASVSYSINSSAQGGIFSSATYSWNIKGGVEGDLSGESKTASGTFTMPQTGSVSITATSSEDDSCVVEGTLITLADGTQKKVEDLTENDVLLVFNHETGKYDQSPLLYNIHKSMEASWHNVIYLTFADGTRLGIVGEHALFDVELNKYVYLNEYNASEYIDHKFVKATQTADGYVSERIALVSVEVVTEFVRVFSPVSLYHLNAVTDGMLSYTAFVRNSQGFVNIFEYDENMMFDVQKMQEDIEKYGLYTYEDFKDYMPIEMFEIGPWGYFKVAVAKGQLTFEDVVAEIYDILYGNVADYWQS